MADEVTPIEQTETVQEQEDTPASPSPSPSPKVTDPMGGQDEADIKVNGENDEAEFDYEPPFQQRMDRIEDSFSGTYQTLGTSKSGADDAKVKRDKAQTVYDGKLTEVSDARSDNLVATRDYIRILQEHEATLVGEG